MKRVSLVGRALLVYGVALALRLRNLREVLVGNKVLFGFDDPYYHLRRVFLTLQHFPFVPDFDFYTNFPTGARITWPPGFDLLVSCVCWIAGAGHPSHHRVEATAALLVPFLGAITSVVVLLLAEEILGRGRWEAFAAALFFAFLPAQQAISSVGRLDHHVVEMIAFGTSVLFFLRALREDRGSLWSFWGGFALAAGTFCWTGSVLYAGFLTGFTLVQMILDSGAGRSESAAARSASRVLFWGALLLIPLVLVSPGDGRFSFTFLYLSWYQPALLGVAAFTIPALSAAFFARGRKRAALRLSGGVMAALTLGALGIWILVKGAGGFEFLFRKDPIIALLMESQPGTKVPLDRLTGDFSYLLYMAPVSAVVLARVILRDLFADIRHDALLALFVFTALLGAGQIRFLNYFAVPFSIATAWAFRHGMEALARRFSSRWLRWTSGSAYGLLVLLPLAPLLRDSVRSQPPDAHPAFVQIYPSLEWLRDKTPPTSHFLSPDRKPEYGVLADFSLGHFITVVGQRPNFCNPFSLAPWHEKPIFESARLFLAEDEGPLLETLDRLQLRYVLLFNNENAVRDYAVLAGRPPDDYLRIDRDRRSATPTRAYFRTFGVRLALTDGEEFQAAGTTIPALTGFRLAHESPETWTRNVPGLEGAREVPRVKIYERVRGAVIAGKTDPGAQVIVHVPVTTNTGRTFDYHARRIAGPDGGFELTVPYPSVTGSEITGGPARIQAPHCQLEVQITESDVVNGARRTVRCR